MITFKDLGFDNYQKYGFIKVATDDLIFSIKKLSLDEKNKEFVLEHFDCFSELYYSAMVLESHSDSNRKRKLYNFIKSVFDQDNQYVKLLMIKSMMYHLKEGLSENDIIDKTIREVLPQCGFYKKLVCGKYLWSEDEKKKFKKGIGKAFVITYINNNFNKDETWKYIKKYCYLNDGIWKYKNDNCERVIEQTFFNYFKDGGIIVKDVSMNEPRKFDAFISLNKLVTEDGEDFLKLEKSVQQSKHPIIKGIASTTGIDRDDERCSKDFLDKMKRTGQNLPILDNTHYASKATDTIGVITETGGDEDTFELTARLMKPEDSESVAYIVKQMVTGIKYGFSIGGRISKVYREFNEDKKKEVYVLDDGELYHVALTTQPANPETLGVAMSKSLSGIKTKALDVNSFHHNSKLAKLCPKSDEVEIDTLPDLAFPIEKNMNTVCKDYPHHFVNDKDVMYLHQELLVQSYQKALSNGASESILNHLCTHLQVIGLSNKIDELENLSKNIESLGVIKEVNATIESEINEFFKTVNSVSEMKTDIESKKKILSKVVMDVSTNLSKIFKKIEEVQNGSQTDR